MNNSMLKFLPFSNGDLVFKNFTLEQGLINISAFAQRPNEDEQLYNKILVRARARHEFTVTYSINDCQNWKKDVSQLL